MKAGSKNRKLVILGSIVAVLAGLRIALPFAVERYVNHVLSTNPDYAGSIGDVDIHLYRGAYSVEDINIAKRQGNSVAPLLSVKRVDFSVGWNELLKGVISSRILIREPLVTLVDAADESKRQTGQTTSIDKTLDRLVPFRITRLIVDNGTLRFRNLDADPPVDLKVSQIDATVRNLTNSDKSKKDLYTSCELHATVMDSGKLTLDVALNPRAPKAAFDIKAKLLGLNLLELNPLFRKYANFDFEKGHGDIVLEVAARNGQLDGYVKPLLKDLKILSVEKDAKEGGVFQVAWEAMAATLKTLLQNQPKDQIATKIPVSGTINAPDTAIFITIGNVLRNAFIQAFSPLYDGRS